MKKIPLFVKRQVKTALKCSRKQDFFARWKVAMSYLKNEQVEVLPWPGNSRDLNSLEI